MSKSHNHTTFQEERKIDRALPALTSDREEQKVYQNLDECLLKISETQQDEPLIQKLMELANLIKTYEIQDFTGYRIFKTYVNGFHSFIQNILIEEGDQISESHERIEDLNILIKKKIELMQIKFMKSILSSANPKELLFDQRSIVTKEEIKKRFHELSLCFHSDKTFFSSNESKELSNQLFCLSSDCKDTLLQALNEEKSTKEKMTVYEDQGDEYWGMAQDCKEAASKHWDRLKYLTKDSVSHLSEEELIRMMREYILLARISYRACCKIADSEKNIEKQTQFRKSIALCFYSEGQYLEAQLYALAAIQLLLNAESATKKDLDEAIKVLNKIKGVHIPVENDQNEGRSTHTAEKALVLLQTSLVEASYLDREGMQKTVHERLRVVVSELTLKSDRSLVKYQYPTPEILRAMKNAKAHKIAGVATMTAGGAGGGIAIFLGTQEIMRTAALLATSVTAGPIIAIAVGLTTIGLGVWGGVRLWKKGNSLYQQPEIREKLNRILAEAVQFYDNGQYNEFLGKLLEEYKPGRSLLSFNTTQARIDPEKIIKCLLYYGFRPDGIAYLLNLIGEVLLSGKISRHGITKRDFITMAKDLFSGSLEESLEIASKSLDNRIPELRKKSRKSKILRIIDKIRLKDHTEIAQEYLKESQEMTFRARLNEIRHISNLNIAVIRILDGEIDEAMEKIKDVQISVKNSKCLLFSKSQTRLEALEDFFWAVSGKNLDDPSPEDGFEILRGITKVYKDYF